ncbi:MAG: cell division protein ZapA [Bacillota bacterium]|nr:cell division protein ZapA [Bacillota bacterium]
MENKVTIRINGAEYTLKGNEKEEYLHTVANYVDRKIRNIMENNPRLDTASASILTALNLADEMQKHNINNENLSDKIEEYVQKEISQTSEINLLKEQIEKLEQENLELSNELKEKAVSGDVSEKEIEIVNLNEQIILMQQETKKYMDKTKALKEENKELKFNMQSYKYKILDLEKKYMESQIELAAYKKKIEVAVKKANVK